MSRPRNDKLTNPVSEEERREALLANQKEEVAALKRKGQNALNEAALPGTKDYESALKKSEDLSRYDGAFARPISKPAKSSFFSCCRCRSKENETASVSSVSSGPAYQPMS